MARDGKEDTRITHVDHEVRTLTAETRSSDDPAYEKSEWLRERVPKTMKAAWTAALTAPGLTEDNYREVVDELYDALNPYGGASPSEVNEALGKGMADMIESEAHMPDGGVFGEGGITGGGIFGADPVATKFTDSAASQRATAARANRVLLGEPEPSQLPGATKKLSASRREKLLKGGE